MIRNVKQRPSGKWRARWNEYPGGPQKARHFDRRADAVRFLDQVQADLTRGEYVDPAEARRRTFGEFADRWMALQPWRPSTRERNASLMRTHVLPHLGDRPLGSIRTSDLQAWTGGLAQSLAPATVEGVFRLASAVLAAAVTDRVIARSPADGVRLPRREGAMLVPLTVEEVGALAEAMPDNLEAAVIVAASTGLRQGELFGLTDDRVKYLRRDLVVDRQLVTPSAGPPRFGPCKTSRSVRTVPVADHVLEVLALHRERHGVGDDGLLFHRDGAPWPRNRAGEAIRRAATAAGVEATWHSLRHHAVSVLIAEGMSVTAVAATLGHSPEECLRTYAGWWPSEHEQIRSAFARAWGAPTEVGLIRDSEAP